MKPQQSSRSQRRPTVKRADVTAGQVFAMLPGTWLILRSIPNQGEFQGSATFTALPDGRLAYHESGILCLGTGATFEAFRAYTYALDLEQSSINIFKANKIAGDVGLLHCLQFETLGDVCTARHRHVCDEDTYDIEFTVCPPTRLQIRYVVQGPRKDYSIFTRMLRQDAATRAETGASKVIW